MQSYQVRPGQAGRAFSAGRTQSADYFSDLWMDDLGYVPIAGACVTFHSDYDLSLAMFFASAHCTVWRQFGPDNGGWPARLAAPDVSIRAFFASGTAAPRTLNHSQRDLPQTVFLDATSPATEGHISTVEQRVTRHFNLSHTKMIDGTTPCDQLLAGEHTFGLAVLVKKNLSGQEAVAAETWDLWLNGATSADARPVSYFRGLHRVRFYARLAAGITLL